MKKEPAHWSEDDVKWLRVIDNLFNEFLSKDYVSFTFTETLVCVVAEKDQPSYTYNHSEWEHDVISKLSSEQVCLKKVSTKKERKCTRPPIKNLFRKKEPVIKHEKPTSEPANIPKFTAEHVKLCLSTSTTRKELMSVQLPNVDSALRVEDVVLVFGEIVTENPFLLQSRPSENVTVAALNALSKCHNLVPPSAGRIVIDETNYPIGVALGRLGSFNIHSVNIFKTFCDIAAMQKNYKYEITWVQQQSSVLSAEDISLLLHFLKESSLNPGVIVKHGDLFVDFKSATSLIGERWVDNFVINFFLHKFIEMNVEQQKMKTISTLPSEAFNWIQNRDGIIHSMLKVNVDSAHNLQFLLVPIHMANCHWGLACVDFVNFMLWFDDGMGWQPPSNLSAVAKSLLQILSSMHPDARQFKPENWTEQSLSPKRFGMPQQLNRTSEGSGSCGVGVILGSRDIIQSRKVPPPFSWNFEQSSYHRAKLLLLILKNCVS